MIIEHQHKWKWDIRYGAVARLSNPHYDIDILFNPDNINPDNIIDVQNYYSAIWNNNNPIGQRLIKIPANWTVA